MSSTQIITTTLLRQFATIVGDEEVSLTSKLGPSTVSRVRFKQMSFPAAEDDQIGFITELVEAQYPLARKSLQGMFEACISDQAKAVKELLAK